MKKYFLQISLFTIAFLFLSSYCFAAQLEPKTIIVKNSVCPKVNAYHRMVLYDRDGDGKYDFIKNFWYYDGDCIKYAEGPISRIKVKDPVNPLLAQTRLCAAIQNSELFTIHNYDFTELDSVIARNEVEITVWDNSEYGGPGLCTMKQHESGDWEISEFWVEELTECKIVKTFTSIIAPDDNECYTFEDLKYEFDEIITTNIINISLGRFTTKYFGSIKIFDSNGILLLSHNLNNESVVNIDISSLSNGTYIIQPITISGTQLGSKSILINK